MYIKKKHKIKNNNPIMTINEIKEVEKGFNEALETDPRFSLEVDPTNQYNFTDIERDFIEQMVQYKNLKFVGNIMLDISFEEALKIYKKYNVQNEIKRINLALYARRFATKMADLDMLGGYLTTALTDENVPVADRLSGKDKLMAVRLLIDINQLKQNMIEKPEIIDVIDVEEDLKKLSVKNIQNLIENSVNDDKVVKKKEDLINEIDKDNLLSPEELTYLRNQSIEELEKLLKEVNKGEINNETK